MIVITTNSQPIDDALQQLQRRLGNLRQPMAEIGQALETSILTRRETHSDPGGNPWADWSPSYAKRYHYKRAGEGSLRGKILERTGAMWESLAWTATESSVRVGFAELYATAHEFGAPARNMPRRGLLFADPQSGALGPEDEAEVLDVLEQWLSGAID